MTHISDSEYTLLFDLVNLMGNRYSSSSYLTVLLTLRVWKTILPKYSTPELADPTLSNMHAIMKSQQAVFFELK